MPLIPDPFLHSIIYLYPSVDGARQGDRAGASGFLTAIPYAAEPELSHVYAVTNAHAIEGGATVIRLNTHGDAFEVLPLGRENWIYHPDGDDIAVAALAGLADFKFNTVSPKLFIREGAGWWGVGDEVFFPGRFVDHEGNQRNSPVVRFGNVAMKEVVRVLQEKRDPRRHQQSLLVEARSISGFSGSPVFVWRSSTFVTGGSELVISPVVSSHVALLGVAWGHHDRMAAVVDREGNPVDPEWSVATNSGLMFVVPAWKVADVIEQSELAEGRVQREAKRALDRKG